ncbi:MAG: pitrilysin family protein [Albidovulum sp.]|nr:pitrilysin family protein [Albidovulum sp.]
MSIRVVALENGFRVATEDMPGLESAAVGLYVFAGGRQEKPEQNGIAHFLEHMAFKGTTTRTALEINGAIESVGGMLNAYTSKEATAYYSRVLAEDVPLAVELIADIVLNPAFQSDDIELERNVILQEIGEAADIPDDMLFEGLQKSIYPRQSLGRPILGSTDLVSQFDAGDLKRFVSEQYVAENMILAAAGAIDHDEVARLATLYFGGMKKKELESGAPGKFSPGEFRKTKKIEQAHLAIAFEGPGFLDHKDQAARVYATIMGGGTSSRLFVEAREKRGLCYTVSASVNSFADTGTILLHAVTGERELPEMARLFIDEIKRSVDDIGEEEAARARTQIRVGFLMSLESPASRIERLARYLGFFGRIPETDEIIAQFDAIDSRKARDFAQGIIESGKAAMAVYGRVKSAPRLDELALRLAESC